MHQKKQKCFQQKGFFAARAFALQSGQNHGLENLPPASPLPPHASAKNPYALPAAPPTMFCPLSPEASSADLKGIREKVSRYLKS
jgi:hypothetical protein